MNFKMIHTCIRVMNLERSEKFYTEAFGFQIARRIEFSDFTLSYLRAPQGDFELELTWNHDQSEPYELGNGYSHLALGVDNLEAAHQRHQEMGLAPKPLKGLPGKGVQFYFIADPDGYLVEIVQQ